MPVGPAFDPSEPLSAHFGAAKACEGVLATPFEYSSGGDRVRGVLWHPGASDATPLVLVGHASKHPDDAREVEALGRAWAAAGAAVATIDLPLHGARASGKLGERVLRAAEPGSAVDALDADLFRHLVHQATTDFGRALTLLADRPDIDDTRLAFAGFGLGARLGAPFCSADSRLCAAVLADPVRPVDAGAAERHAATVTRLDSAVLTAASRNAAWRALAPGLGLLAAP
jgi:dienelactone hydrolase